ncbi:MAG: hypothetical protein ABI228_07535, partial [Burkholderiaceae bacterium]
KAQHYGKCRHFYAEPSALQQTRPKLGHETKVETIIHIFIYSSRTSRSTISDLAFSQALLITPVALWARPPRRTMLPGLSIKLLGFASEYRRLSRHDVDLAQHSKPRHANRSDYISH